MTDKEYENSLKYYQNLLEEIKIEYDEAKIFIKEKFNLNSDYWRIDYLTNQIIVYPNIEDYKKAKPFFNNLNTFAKTLAEEEGNFSKKLEVIEFELTNRCNGSCSYCFEKYKGNEKMSFDDAKKMIDMILQSDNAIKNRIDSYTSIGTQLWFLGGETLLEFDLMNSIVEYFIGELFRLQSPWIIWFYFRISTNGLLYFNENVQQFFQKYQSCLICSLTIDWNKECHNNNRKDENNEGTYNHVMNVLFHCQKHYPGVLIPRNIITNYNLKYLKEAAINTIKNNIIGLEWPLEFHQDWNKQQALEFYNQLNSITDWQIENNQIDFNLSFFDKKFLNLTPYGGKKGCKLLNSKIIVDWQGNYYPCIQMGSTTAGERYLNIGTTNNGIGFSNDEIYNLNKINDYLTKQKPPEQCQQCIISGMCFCCPCYNYLQNGDLNYNSYNACWMTKALYLANIYHWKKLGYSVNILLKSEDIIDFIGINEYQKINEIKVALI